MEAHTRKVCTFRLGPHLFGDLVEEHLREPVAADGDRGTFGGDHDRGQAGPVG